MAPPASPEAERRRARLVILLATIGIAAALLAYAISPGVRHAVSHAAHSVGNVLDRDKKKKAARPGTGSTQPAGRSAAPTSTTGGSGSSGGSAGAGSRTTTSTGGTAPGG
jgi:hypothetical protein